MKLTVIGTTFVDIKGYPIGQFVPTGRNAGRMQQFYGGVSRNIAEDIANCGIDVDFISLVDEGGIGADVVEHLKKKGVNVDYVRTSKDGMGTWMAIFDPTGDVYASISKRPFLMPICNILDECGDECIPSTDAILLEIDIDEEIVEKTFEYARKYNKPVYSVISNITVALERMQYILQSDCFVCNRQEAVAFFGLKDDDFANQENALNALCREFDKLPLKSMVVTLDSDGAVYVSQSGESGAIEPKKVNVVDTTGAGDSFFAGVSIGLAGGDSLKDACERANHMASVVIQNVGNVYTHTAD